MANEIDIRPSLLGWPGAVNGAALPAEQQQLAFEQYKLYLELTDRISQRRQAANSFFVGVNTAVIALLGYVNAKQPVERFYLLICIAGMVLCFLWYRTVRSYRDLNTAKFAVIHEIELLLPLHPYRAEWDFVGRGQVSKFYKPFTHIEIGVPWLFLLMYAFIFLWLLIA